MGLFKSSSIQSNRHRAMQQRKSYASQQVKEMRYKARSKLIGAVLLAIIGLIALPFIFSNEAPLSSRAPQQAPLQANTHQISISTGAGVNVVEGGIAPESATGTLAPSTMQVPSAPDAAQTPSSVVSIAASTANYTSNPREVAQAAGQPQAEHVLEALPLAQSAAEKPAPVLENSPKKLEKNSIKEEERTDDGALALALLQGKKGGNTPSVNHNFPTPSSQGARATPSPATQASAHATANTAPSTGQYVVQVGSYATMEEAQSQRNALSGSGVSNAFVQGANVNGRQTYRLRVGPFISKESAQAALTRLRGLGREDGYITSY